MINEEEVWGVPREEVTYFPAVDWDDVAKRVASTKYKDSSIKDVTGLLTAIPDMINKLIAMPNTIIDSANKGTKLVEDIKDVTNPYEYIYELAKPLKDLEELLGEMVSYPQYLETFVAPTPNIMDAITRGVTIPFAIPSEVLRGIRKGAEEAGMLMPAIAEWLASFADVLGLMLNSILPYGNINEYANNNLSDLGKAIYPIAKLIQDIKSVIVPFANSALNDLGEILGYLNQAVPEIVEPSVNVNYELIQEEIDDLLDRLS